MENPVEIATILHDISSDKYNLESISSKAISTATGLGWNKTATQYFKTYQQLLE